MSKLAVSMIVRNEEAMIRRCLDSVVGADRIVILDTGSNDATSDVVRRWDLDHDVVDFHEGVYSWRDDFADARNKCLDQCHEPWVLTIDADEYLELGAMAKIKEAISSTNERAFGVRCQVHGGEAYHISPRVYRNIPEHRWHGKAHNWINVPKARKLDATLRYDFSPAHRDDPRRTIRILTNEASEKPNDARTLYYLASEHLRHREYEVTLHYVERCLAQKTGTYYHPEAWLLAAKALWQLRRAPEAREACFHAIEWNANFKEAILLMAEMSFEHNAVQWQKMAETADNRNVVFVR